MATAKDTEHYDQNDFFPFSFININKYVWQSLADDDFFYL